MGSKVRDRLEEKLKRIKWGGLGAVTLGNATFIPFHEGGHLLVDLLLGGSPTIGANSKVAYVNTTSYLKNPSFGLLVKVAGPIANYLAALSFAIAARKVDGEKHPKLKDILSGSSIFHPLSLACADTGAYFKPPYTDLLTIFGMSGVPKEFVIPLSLAASAALIYYTLRGYKKSS